LQTFITAMYLGPVTPKCVTLNDLEMPFYAIE